MRFQRQSSRDNVKKCKVVDMKVDTYDVCFVAHFCGDNEVINIVFLETRDLFVSPIRRVNPSTLSLHIRE